MRSGGRRGIGAVIALVGLLLPASTPLPAQWSAPIDSTRRDSLRAQVIAPVQVTVTGRAQPLPRLPWAVGTQELRDLRRGQATLGIDEALANIPGVVIANRYNAAVDQRLSIRGAGSRANFGVRGVKVLLDGIPQSLPDGQSQLTNIDLAAIGRVEVLRGSASALYGNGSGGVLSFTTDLSAPDPLGATVRVLQGAFGLRKSQLRLSGRGAATVGALSLSRTSSDGFRQHSAFVTEQLSLALDRALGGARVLELRTGLAETPMAFNPGALTLAEYARNPDTAALANVRRGARRAIAQRHLSARLRGGEGPHTWNLSLYGQGRTVDNPLATPPPAPAGPTNGIYSTIDRVVTGARAEGTRALGTGARLGQLTSGVDLQRSRDWRRNWRATAGARELPTDTLLLEQREVVTSVGPFAQWLIDPWDWMTLSAGGRLDHLTFAIDDRFAGDGDDDSGRRTMQAWSGHLGVVLRPHPAVAPYLNWSTAFETPTTTELNARPEALGGFNPALGPQQTATLEVGVRGTVGGSHLRYEVAVFDARARDAIVQYLETNGRAFFQNAGRTRSRGAEVGVIVAPHRAVELRTAWTRADYTFVTYRVPSATRPAPARDTLDGNRLAGVPRTSVRLGARITHAGFALDADHTLQSALWGNDANTVRVPGWGRGVLQLRASWRGPIGAQTVEPFVAVQNLLDQPTIGAVTLNGAFGRVLEPAPRRTFYVGLEIGRALRR
ncbi:MAG: TonB-dependent receptor family protein [Gemmatimonadaceae bacterium]